MAGTTISTSGTGNSTAGRDNISITIESPPRARRRGGGGGPRSPREPKPLRSDNRGGLLWDCGLALLLITFLSVVTWLHVTTMLPPAKAVIANALFALVCGVAVSSLIIIWRKWGVQIFRNAR